MRFTTSTLALLLLAACDGPGMVEAPVAVAPSPAANNFLDKVTVASFSAASRSEVNAKFRGVVESGFDGIGLLRLVSQTADPYSRSIANDVAATVREQAEQHGRLFSVEYELAGAREGTWSELIKRDWTETMKRVAESPAYARQDGRPVVVLRGLGFSDRPGTVAEAMDVIDWFKSQGCYVVGGVPASWRSGVGSRPNFLAAFLRLDAIRPWADGAVVTVSAGAPSEDRAFAAQFGIAYQQLENDVVPAAAE
jgi:hypothetical protein